MYVRKHPFECVLLPNGDIRLLSGLSETESDELRRTRPYFESLAQLQQSVAAVCAETERLCAEHDVPVIPLCTTPHIKH